MYNQYGQAPPQHQYGYPPQQQQQAQQPQYAQQQQQQHQYPPQQQQQQMTAQVAPAAAPVAQTQAAPAAAPTANVVEPDQTKPQPIYVDTQHDDMVHDAQLDYYGTKLATSSSGESLTVQTLIILCYYALH